MEFYSHIVVTSQSMNKKMGAPPPLVLFTNKLMPNLITLHWCTLYFIKFIKLLLTLKTIFILQKKTFFKSLQRFQNLFSNSLNLCFQSLV